MDDAHKVAMLQFRWDKEAAAERVKGFNASTEAIMGGIKAAGGFAAAMIGVSSAGQVLTAVLERFEKLRVAALEESHKMTEEAADLRRLSILEGNAGAPSLTQARQLALRGETNQTAQEAAAMTEAARASGYGAIQAGRVSKEDFDKFLVSQGRLQTLTHADARAVGQAAGMMPMLTGKKKNTAEDLEARAAGCTSSRSSGASRTMDSQPNSLVNRRRM